MTLDSYFGKMYYREVIRMITLIYVFGIILLIGSLVAIFFLIKNDKLKNLTYKIDMCERDIDSFLKIKEENVLRLISIINRELNLDIKEFESVKNLKTNKPNNIEKDVLLAKTFEEIKKIYMDNNELSKVKSFDGIVRDIDKNEINIISLRTLYNKCSSEFNNIKVKFPYNLICSVKKLETKELYKGKELQEVIEKELDNLVI